MKDETLKKFREEYTTYLEAADSEFEEIGELKKELEKDPRVIQLKKLQEEINNDPRTKRLEELKKIKKDYEQQKQEYGYWNYTNSYYAYIKTRPIINGEDSCGILVRFTSRRDIETYFYLDVETFESFRIEKDKAEEFEKGHIIIPVPSDANEEAIRREFFIGCIKATPEESAKILIEKYNAKEKDQTEQTAFGVTFEEFSKIYDENNGFDVRYPEDSLSAKTSNKKLAKKIDNNFPTNNQCESKD